jgi:geranylgeranyl pyrophosphate synthase
LLPAETPTLGAIRSPIAEPFERFQAELDDAFTCDVGLVGTVGAHLHRAFGKRFRPTLVLLAAKGFGRWSS